MLRQCLFRSKRLLISPSFRPYRTKGSKNKATLIKEDATKSPIKSVENRIIDPGSSHHNDLSSFITYAKRLSLSETSTVYIGTHYEYMVASSISRLGFALTRTGKQSDRGIDLLGHWHVPSLPAPIRVLLQCKAHSKKLTPAHIRELEGSFAGAPAGWQGEGVLGLLASMNGATAGMREAMIRSRLPIGFLQVSDEGRVCQFLWNHEAGQIGLEGLGVTTRFIPGKAGVEEEIALTWNGWVLNKDGIGETRAEVEGKSSKEEESDVKKVGKAEDKAAPKKKTVDRRTEVSTAKSAKVPKSETIKAKPKKPTAKSRSSAKAKGQRKKNG